MISLPKDTIFQFNPNTVLNVRKQYNLEKTEDMEQAIDILQDWLKQQEHITNKIFPRKYLERIIINEKGSIERAKISIDRMCTVRTLLPRFFEINDCREIYKVIKGTFIEAALPKPTKENFRVFIPQIVRNGFTSEMLFSGMQLVTIFCDYYKIVDYSDGIVIISDFTNVDVINGMKVLNLVDIRQAVTVFLDGYHIRIKGIHFISPSSTIDLFVSFLKTIINKKLADRIHLHKCMEDLHKFVPKEILPVDYGGEEKPLKEIFADWIEFLSLDNTLAMIKEIRKSKTDENYRSTVKFNEEYMGMAGTFRKFTVD